MSDEDLDATVVVRNTQVSGLNEGQTTRRALRAVWSHKGWVEVRESRGGTELDPQTLEALRPGNAEVPPGVEEVTASDLADLTAGDAAESKKGRSRG